MSLKLKSSITVLMFLMFQNGSGMPVFETAENDVRRSIQISVGTNDKQTKDGTIWKFIRGLGSYNDETGTKALQVLLDKNNLPLLITTEFSWRILKKAVDEQNQEDKKAIAVRNILLQEYDTLIGTNSDNTGDGTIWKFIRGLDRYDNKTGDKALRTLLEKNNLILPITEEFSWKTLKRAVEEQSSEIAKVAAISRALQEKYDFLLGTNTEDTEQGTVWRFVRGLGNYSELSGAMALKSVLNRCQVRIPYSKDFTWKTLKRVIDEQHQEDRKAAAVYNTIVRECYKGQAYRVRIDEIITKKSNYEAWFRAAKFGDMSAIISLMRKGININSRDENSKTAITHLVLNGHSKVIKQLLNDENETILRLLMYYDQKQGVSNKFLEVPIHGRDKFVIDDEIDNEAICHAARYLSTGVVKSLLNIGAKYGCLTLKGAAESWRRDIVELLISEWQHSDLGELFDATITRDIERIKYLINKGEKPDFNALWGATVTGRRDIMKLLLDNAENPNLNKIFENAAKYGQSEIIELLLNKGVNPARLNVLEQFAKHGCYQDVKLLLNKGANPNYESNRFAISRAAENGFQKVVELLIEKGVSANFQKEALISSAKSGHTKIVELLLNNLYEVAVTRRALVEASKYGHAEVVKLLLDKRDCISSEALLEAVRYGHLEVVKILNRRNFRLNKEEALLVAAEGGYKDIVNLLINNRVKPDSRAIEIAAKGGHKDIVNLLINKGIKPNSKAIEVAAEGGYKDIVNLLINNGVNLDSKVIEYAAKGGHAELIKLFMDLGVKPNSNALQNAAIKGYIDIVELLLDNGINPEIENLGSVSAFDKAIKFNQIGIVNLLLKRVCNHVFSVYMDMKLQMSLTNASDQGNFEIVKLLLDYGVNPNLTSALFEAVKRGYIDIVKLLIERGANPNGNRGEDNTLIAAVANNRWDILELLLDKGANIESSCSIGDTALSYAVKRGDMRQIAWLLNRGAKINDLVQKRALERPDPNIIQLLLNRGMNPHVRNFWGMSMIDIARSCRCEEYIIRMLEEA